MPSSSDEDALQREQIAVGFRRHALLRQWDRHDRRMEREPFAPYPTTELFGAYSAYVPALESYIRQLEKQLGIQDDDRSLTMLLRREEAGRE